MASSPWTKIYWADFIGDTLRLSPEEVGVYILLLADYYQTESAIPDDPSIAYRIARAEKRSEKQSVDRVLEKHFIKCDGFYWNKRADKEIAKRQKLRENGTKGGRPKLRGVV